MPAARRVNRRLDQRIPHRYLGRERPFLKLRLPCLCIALIAAANTLYAQAPGKEIALPPEEVKDTFFAYVIGVIRAGVEVRLFNSDLRGILTEFKSSLDLPFDLISSVSQFREPGVLLPNLEILFNGPVKIPIPFSFLGYHPGSIHASQAIDFTETRPVSSSPLDIASPDAVYSMRLSRGEVLVDVDGWLEWLLPSLIQDTIVDLICIYHDDSGWYCLLAGTGRNTGTPIRQFFDFTRNRIVIPVSARQKELGERLARAGALMY
jgi:hypothetical protein